MWTQLPDGRRYQPHRSSACMPNWTVMLSLEHTNLLELDTHANRNLLLPRTMAAYPVGARLRQHRTPGHADRPYGRVCMVQAGTGGGQDPVRLARRVHRDGAQA